MLVAHEILLSSPGTGGTFYSLFSIFQVPFPISKVPSPKAQSKSLDKNIVSHVTSNYVSLLRMDLSINTPLHALGGIIHVFR